MGGIFEYFVACGLGSEMRTMDGNKGYHGMRVLYLPFLLDQYPLDNHSLYPPPPPQLPTCVFPAGVEFYPSGLILPHFQKVTPLFLLDLVLFAIENCLLSVEAPPKDGLPHVEISFQPLVQCLDVDNLLKLFTAVLLERRILLRSNKHSLLTLASEAICHLIYPFTWQWS